MTTTLSGNTAKQETLSVESSPLDPESEVMVIDEETFKDLEVFESELSGETLFALCNHTRNKKGADALRERMKRPWSNPERIRAVQESLSFMIEQRPAFDRLPSFVTTEIVERYFHGGLPIVTSRNNFEFAFGVFDLRYSDVNRYFLIVHSVETTSSIISTLRDIVFSEELASPKGELAPIIEEMRTLLSLPGLSQITKKISMFENAWSILRTDQVFRIHEKKAIARLLTLTYEIDALLSMADTTKKHGYIIPTVEDGPLAIEAEGVTHPFVEGAVSNPISLDQNQRLLFLTGPNMAGKTTYLRSCAIALYFAHLGMGVPASSYRFTPAQRLFSSITLSDNLHAGVSFFLAEALRIKAIAKSISEGHSVIALMDEPFKGTNIKDAYDASHAILERFTSKANCLFMFSSHLIELCDLIDTMKHVDCRNFEAKIIDGRLNFEYELRPGISTQRLGMHVLKEVGIFDLLDK